MYKLVRPLGERLNVFTSPTTPAEAYEQDKDAFMMTYLVMKAIVEKDAARIAGQLDMFSGRQRDEVA